MILIFSLFRTHGQQNNYLRDQLIKTTSLKKKIYQTLSKIDKE